MIKASQQNQQTKRSTKQCQEGHIVRIAKSKQQINAQCQ
jgi:hypothetical protein